MVLWRVIAPMRSESATASSQYNPESSLVHVIGQKEDRHTAGKVWILLKTYIYMCFFLCLSLTMVRKSAGRAMHFRFSCVLNHG